VLRWLSGEQLFWHGLKVAIVTRKLSAVRLYFSCRFTNRNGCHGCKNTAPAAVIFNKTNSFMVFWVNKNQYFSTTVFKPSTPKN
jgi:hypothetical protein